MNNRNCLSEQDLVLHYYRELPDSGGQVRHLSGCTLCAERFATLSRDLAKLPQMTHEPDHAAGTRMAARVRERLHDRRSNWLPALGASAVAAIALVVTLALWTPQSPQVQTAQLDTSSPALTSLDEDMPDIDFLEDLDVLRDLELLRQLEGV